MNRCLNEKEFYDFLIGHQVIVRAYGHHIHTFLSCFMVQSPIGDKYQFVKMTKGIKNKRKMEYMICPGCYSLYRELFDAGITNIWNNSSLPTKDRK